jgi:restriction endonuclease Mrr
MFDSAGQAIETLAAEYAIHGDVDPKIDLTTFFEPALGDTDPETTVGPNREQYFRPTAERGRSLAKKTAAHLGVDEAVDRLVEVANDNSVEAGRRAAYIDYCDDLFALAALVVELRQRYPSAPVEAAVDDLREAGTKAARDDLQDGIDGITGAGEELYRTAVVVRRADQLFDALNAVNADRLGTAEATLGGTLDEAIARRDRDRIDTVAEKVSAAANSEWTRSDLFDCSPREFEVLVADLWREGGFDARTTEYVQDFNIDVIAESGRKRELIQAKQYGRGNTVGVETVQRTAGLLVEFTADSVAVVTSSTFTTSAKESADRMDETVRLIDGEKLCELLTKSQLMPSL